MDVASFARDAFMRQGERDAGKIAQEYIKAALGSDDPVGDLLPAVRMAFFMQFSELRKRLRDELGDLDDPPAPPPDFPPEQFRMTMMQRRALLMREQVWTRTRGSISWMEITIEDIIATIAHYRREIGGIEKHVAQLESARRLIELHQVRCLGEIPPEEWQ